MNTSIARAGLLAMNLLLFGSIAMAEGTRGTVVIVDSVDRVVGRAVGNPSYLGVLLTGQGVTAAVRLQVAATGGNGLEWLPSPVFFLAPNCRGTGYIESYLTPGSKRDVAANKIGNQWIGYLGSLQLPGVIVAQSVRETSGLCLNTPDDDARRLLLSIEKSFSLDRFGIPPFYYD